jgi:uncharacterized MAPEG superfamily protein
MRPRTPGVTLAGTGRVDPPPLALEHRDVARVVRVHRNQLENFAPFFALGLLWLSSEADAGLGAALFATFALARKAHLAFYLARMGRLRTASQTVSFVVLLLLAGGVA